MMRTFEAGNAGVATHITSILSVKKQSAERAQAGFTEAENPRCGVCGHWSSLIRGKFGPFFSCVSGCGWKQSASMPR
jgi:hypothetical protein